jgi:hypothetical protein
MKKIAAAFLLILGMGILQYGKVLGSLPVDYLKLPILRMDDRQIYVVDKLGKRGYIFERKTLKKIAEFGKKGQGPGEFPGVSGFTINDQYLYVSAGYKLCIFSKRGNLQKEIKQSLFIYNILPSGKYFLGQKNLPANRDSDDVKIQFSLYDSNFEKKKDVFLTTIHAYVHFKKGKKITHLVNNCVEASVYNNLIIIGTTEKDFYLIVFNRDGEMLYEIKRDIEKRKISAAKKQQILDNMKKYYGEEKWKAFTSANEIEIPDFIPAYQAFFVNDNKIYVFRYPEKEGQEIIIMDLKGNLIAKKIVPEFRKMNINAEYDYLMQGKVYKIIENDAGESELHEYEIPF